MRFKTVAVRHPGHLTLMQAYETLWTQYDPVTGANSLLDGLGLTERDADGVPL